jgi:hypothetical protein
VKRSGIVVALATIAAGAVTGCGTFVPDFGEFYDTTPPINLIDAIVSHVHCEVKSQIQFLILDDIEIGKSRNPQTGVAFGRHLEWLDSWGAQLSLSLTVEEKTTLSPGVTLNTVLPNVLTPFPSGTVTSPQSANVSFGVGGSADATRKAVVSWFIDFRDFVPQDPTTYPEDPKEKVKAKERRRAALQAFARAEREYLRIKAAAQATNEPVDTSICSNRGGVLIEGDIKFREWLYMMLRPAFVRGGVVDYATALKNEIKVAKKDALQDQITFVMQYNGNVTPSWKLVKVSANPSGTFFNAQRTRTQDLTITMGPAPDDAKAAALQKAQNDALAAAIGNAVASAIHSREP